MSHEAKAALEEHVKNMNREMNDELTAKEGSQ